MNKASEIATAVRAAFDHIRPDLIEAVMSEVRGQLPTEATLLGAVEARTGAVAEKMDHDAQRAREDAQRAAEHAERRLAALVREWVEDRGEKREERSRELIEAAIVRQVAESVERIPKPRDGRDGESIFWRGDHKTGKTYGQFDVVKLDGSAWIARRGTDERPGEGEDWGLLVAKGDQGDRGNSVVKAEVRNGRLFVKTDDFEVDAGDVTGPKGPRGVKGDVGQGFRYRGDWSKSKAYRKQDVTARHGSTWVAAIDLKGVEPGSDPRWRIFTPPGQRGKRGDKGAPGRGIASVEGSAGKAIVTFTDGETQTISVDGIPVWRGPFDPLQEYVRGDVVSKSNGVWIMVADQPVSASAPSSQNADWDVMLRAPQPVQATGGGSAPAAPDMPELTLDEANLIGTTAAEPYQITKGFTRLVPADADSAVRVPDDKEGRWIALSSGVAQNLPVYPQPGGQINYAGVDVPFDLNGFQPIRLICIDAASGLWVTW